MSAGPTLPPGYALGEARLADLAAVRRLERVAFARDAYDPLTLVALTLRQGNVNLKVTAPGEGVVGHVTGSPRPLFGVAWIVTLAVAPDHRRRGIGRALLAACEARLRPPLVRLTVRASNSPAIALYEGVGYRRVGVERRYYRGGEDGIVMEKRRA